MNLQITGYLQCTYSLLILTVSVLTVYRILTVYLQFTGYLQCTYSELDTYSVLTVY